MRNSLLSLGLIVGLMLPMGAIHAQETNTVTATCKDGTAFTGTKRSGACRGHGGVQSWGAASATTGPVGSTPPVYGGDEPAHRSEPDWGPGPSLGQHQQQSVSLPRHPMVRQDQAGQLHVRGGCAGTGRKAG